MRGTAESIAIRRAEDTDLPRIRDIYNQAVLRTTATAEIEPVSFEERSSWLRARRELDLPVLVAHRDALVIGWASLNPYSHKYGYRFTAENSVYVDEAHRGRGIGRALLARTIEEARTLGLHRLVASLDSENHASLKIHGELGFVVAGRYSELIWKFDRWLDVVHLELRL